MHQGTNVLTIEVMVLHDLQRPWLKVCFVSNLWCSCKVTGHWKVSQLYGTFLSKHNEAILGVENTVAQQKGPLKAKQHSGSQVNMMVMEEKVIRVLSDIPVVTPSCSPTAASHLGNARDIKHRRFTESGTPRCIFHEVIFYDRAGLSSDATIRGGHSHHCKFPSPMLCKLTSSSS